MLCAVLYDGNGKVIDSEYFNGEKKEFTGILKGYDEGTVTIEIENGTEKIFDKSDIALIRLAFDF
ncbi:hypothetical protein [uncultured Ligilactobacillus sp.]|uniref:hypothetical protein n=1 Tax=uncultured Ligilactobacillus sp. TaxID=2837633 RepID=UPI00272A9EBA|nr:hypothetical protein [uncultured Ligilactobacillus sp.]